MRLSYLINYYIRTYIHIACNFSVISIDLSVRFPLLLHSVVFNSFSYLSKRADLSVVVVVVVVVAAAVVVIPAKARDYVFTGVGLSVCLSVCLSVFCYHDN